MMHLSVRRVRDVHPAPRTRRGERLAEICNCRRGTDGAAFEREDVSRRTVMGLSILATPFVQSLPASVAAVERDRSIYDFEAMIRGRTQSFKKYRDQNLNYPGLRKLREKYGSMGFTLVAFPCNQFGGQAPGTSEEERSYAIKKFGFRFDVYDKIEVNGEGAHPLYQFLKASQPDSLPSYGFAVGDEVGQIEWNYTKFLINRDGRPVRRYRPGFDPVAFEGDVVQLLNRQPLLPEACLRDTKALQCQF